MTVITVIMVLYPGAHLSASAIISKIIKNQTSDSTIFNKTAYLGLPNNPRLTALSVEMNKTLN